MTIKFRRMATLLKNVPEVIAALGGNDAVAAHLDTTYNAVSNWRLRGRLPAHTYLAIRTLLKRRGFEAPDRLWAMTRARRVS